MQAAGGASLSDAAHEAVRRPRRSSLFALVAILGLALDQITKQIVVTRWTEDIELVGSLLKVHLTFNPGAAFSTGTGLTFVISCVAIVATCVVIWLGTQVRDTLWAIGFGLLLAGITGNLTDRLFRDPAPMRGHVVDFLQLPNWPIFNVADICINLAAAIIIIQSFRGIRMDGTRTPAPDAEPDSGADGPQAEPQ